MNITPSIQTNQTPGAPRHNRYARPDSSLPLSDPLDLFFRGGDSETTEKAQLLAAVRCGREKEVAKLLDQGANPNMRDENKLNLLYLAVWFNQPKVLDVLLAHGADPNLPRESGQPPLHVAAWKNKLSMVQRLLEKGANPNIPDDNGSTPLHFAAEDGRIEIVQALLAKNADPNLPDTGKNTPLHLATRMGNTAVVQALLEKQASVHLLNDEKQTPLHIAAGTNNPALVKVFLEKGADPNLPDHLQNTPLHMAAWFDNPVSIQALLEKNANPNAPDENRDTPLHVAAGRGHLKALQLLLAHGADPNRGNDGDMTPLHMATHRNRMKLVLPLLDHGAKPNMTAINGKTPLAMGAEHGYSKGIQVLLARGADPNLGDKNGTTPLHVAVRAGHTRLVQALLNKGADMNVPNLVGKSPLAVATEQGYSAMAKLLASKGADPNVLTTLEQQLLYRVESPATFLQFMTLHQQELTPNVLTRLFQHVENRYPLDTGKKLLPELMALLPLYARQMEKVDATPDKASEALTRLYGFTDPKVGGYEVEELLGSAYRNWGTLGTLGLSFSRWRFDTMNLWKGFGPSEKPPLLVQSGLFRPTPPRADDDKYFRSFTHSDPASGLSVELRRAYIVISKPGLGSLVVRNSSHHYGRDLFPEPAYYHPDKTYGHSNAQGGKELLNPNDLLTPGSGYRSVLDKGLNRTVESQAEFHENIHLLLTDFQKVMDDYTTWKCGFLGGNAPQGLRPLLEAAVASAANDGVASPFGKQKNVRLAWVNPYELPAPVATLDLSRPEILKEAELFLNVQKGRAVLSSPDDYQTRMPHLMNFLSEGTRQGLELVLVS